MKKRIGAICLVLMLFLLSSCGRLLTPEELIRPPEMNVGNKLIKDALSSILPQGAVLYSLPYMSQNKQDPNSQEQAFTLQDFDGDGEKDVIALYRNGSMQMFGVIVLKKEKENWNKKFEIKLDALEIQDYSILDIDKDGYAEIVVGYINKSEEKLISIFKQEGKELENIFEEQYYSFEFSDFEKGRDTYLILSNFSTEPFSNSVKLFRYRDGMMKMSDQVFYSRGMDPYHVQVGKIDENHMGVFVDLYVNSSYGQSDVLLFKEGKIKSIVTNKEKVLSTQNYPTQSTDIDSDGIVEVVQTIDVSSTSLQHFGKPVFVKDYLKIIDLSSLKLVEEIYEDSYDMHIKIVFPKEFWNKYFMVKDPYSEKLTIYYRPDEKEELLYFPLMEIQHLDIAYKLNYGSYYVINETDSTITVCRTINSEQTVPESYRNEYRKLLQITQSPEKFIKPLE